VGTVVLDSSVLLGLADATDALHAASVAALREREESEFIIPASVFAEIMVGALRLGERTAQRIEDMVDAIASAVQPIDRRIALEAAAIRARRTSIRLPDALVLATGAVLEAEVLTADKRWRDEPGHVTVLEV
jgi:predicted nucleic acid-binding protein